MSADVKMDVYLIYAETQLHAGRGAELGVVDLPIQRERTTGFPIIQGVKGALRAFVRTRNDKNLEEALFGSRPSEKGEQAAQEEETVQKEETTQESEGTKPGGVAFSEAKILLFPVRNNERLFVWVTCPLALARFLKVAKDEEALKVVNNLNLGEHEAVALFESKDNEIWLEEIAVLRKDVNTDELKKLFEKISDCAPIDLLKNKLKENVVIVSDKLFSQIVETMTEVVPRVRIDTTGTVKEGALWYEEYLPQDTVMYFVARPTGYASNNVLEDLKNVINVKLINIGGKETVGKGMVWIKSWG